MIGIASISGPLLSQIAYGWVCGDHLHLVGVEGVEEIEGRAGSSPSSVASQRS
jgi:hypothetical protein